VCYFIVFGVSRDSSIDLRGLLSQELSIERISNASLTNRMGTAIDLFMLTSNSCPWGNTGRCSCGLYLGADGPDENEATINKRCEKYIGRGWSAAKIERAIRNRGWAQNDESIGMREDAREFLAHVAEAAEIICVVAFNHGDAATWRIFYHEHQGLTANEVRERKTAIPEGLLIWIRSE